MKKSIKSSSPILSTEKAFRKSWAKGVKFTATPRRTNSQWLDHKATAEYHKRFTFKG